MRSVLVVGVLTVVDQQRCVLSEAEARDPIGAVLVEVPAKAGFVVGYVAQDSVALGDAVAQRDATVMDGRRPDPRRAELPLEVRWRCRPVEEADRAMLPSVSSVLRRASCAKPPRTWIP